MHRKIFLIVWLTILQLTFISSCKPSESKNIEQKDVENFILDSTLILKMKIPKHFDTIVSWVLHGDHGKGSDEYKMIFQSKSLAVFYEKGMYWQSPTDSVNRLVVSHFGYTLGSSLASGLESIQIFKERLKSEIEADRIYPPVITDTVAEINGRFFSIIKMKRQDSLTVLLTIATTIIKGHPINFQYEFRNRAIADDSVSINFDQRTMESIHSITILEKK